jgi:hypothetical protein
VDVGGDFRGYTDDSGTFEVSVPADLGTDDECRIEIPVDDARPDRGPRDVRGSRARPATSP